MCPATKEKDRGLSLYNDASFGTGIHVTILGVWALPTPPKIVTNRERSKLL